MISETSRLLPPTIAQQWVALLLTEQGSEEIPDLRQIKSYDDAQNGSNQFRQRVELHGVHLVFLRLPLAGAGFFLALGFAGTLAGGFLPLAGAFGGGAV